MTKDSETKAVPAFLPEHAVFPPSNVLGVAIDYVPSISFGPGTVKFYMCRVDSELYARGDTSVVPVVQIVMPNVGFAHMVVFFEKQLEGMIARGLIEATAVDDMRKVLTQTEVAPDVD